MSPTGAPVASWRARFVGIGPTGYNSIVGCPEAGQLLGETGGRAFSHLGRAVAGPAYR